MADPHPSVFSPEHFKNPAHRFRPLQIIHGMDHLVDQAEEDTSSNVVAEDQIWPQADPASLPVKGLANLERFLQKLDALGTGGIVTNVGFKDYLTSPRQWEILRHGLRTAASLGLHIWLYDEKGYPSGTAGGYVTRANPEYTALGLACYPLPVTGPCQVVYPLPVSCQQVVWVGATRRVETAMRADFIDLTPHLDAWQTLHWDAPAGEWTLLYLAERRMYEGTHASRNVSEFKNYANLLDAEAVRAFIRVTHEAYVRELGPELWSQVEAVFTDEPSFVTQYLPDIPEIHRGKIPVLDGPLFLDRPPALPWVNGFLDLFKVSRGYDLAPFLYALFFSEQEEACLARQDYYAFLTELYTRAFFDPIQKWCQVHGIASSGHVLLEESILDHPAYEGSLLGVLKHMDLPGIDMLNSSPPEMLHGGSFMGKSFMAAKQAASAAHLSGSRRIHSESSDWEQQNTGRFASLSERLGQANLQYALGINLITSYFGWQEIGEAGWKHYNDTIGRLSSLLTGGQHLCDVAVLYPIRTMWAHFLPPLQPMQSWDERPIRTTWARQADEAFTGVVGQLLTHQVDLDILDEESLCAAEIQSGRLVVGGESYRTIVLPAIDALGLEAAQVLERFASQGGQVVSCGSLPVLAGRAEDAVPLRNIIGDLFAPSGAGKSTSLAELPGLLQSFYEPDLTLDTPDPDILYTHRRLEGRELYFIVNCSLEPRTVRPLLRTPGPFEIYDPETGDILSAVGDFQTAASVKLHSSSPLELHLEGCGSLFLVRS